jgi:hypothetical protein
VRLQSTFGTGLALAAKAIAPGRFFYHFFCADLQQKEQQHSLQSKLVRCAWLLQVPE